MSYALQWEALERETLAYIGVAGAALAAGAEGVEIPTLSETRRQFDEWLLADEDGDDDGSEESAMRRALRPRER